MVAGSNPAERTVDTDNMDERRRDELTSLRDAIKDNSANIESLSGALMQFAVHADEQNQALRKEVRDHRKLAKYSRRTHFWTMTAMVFGALLLADVAQHADSQWWGLVFWATQHGNGGSLEWTLRAVGLLWQATYLAFLVKIAQVPDDLWTAAMQVKKERAELKSTRNPFNRSF